MGAKEPASVSVFSVSVFNVAVFGVPVFSVAVFGVAVFSDSESVRMVYGFWVFIANNRGDRVGSV